MFNKELRKHIGQRVKLRRKELGLTLQYVAERMDVSASTILRYENGSIDNTKKLIVEGLADVLRVSPDWLLGNTDEIEDTHSDEMIVKIEDLIGEILSDYPLAVGDVENEFSKEILLLLLYEFRGFNEQFVFAVQNYTKPGEVTKDIAKMAKASGEKVNQKEINSSMFAWQVKSFSSRLNLIADCVRDYAREPIRAKADILALLRNYIYD